MALTPHHFRTICNFPGNRTLQAQMVTSLVWSRPYSRDAQKPVARIESDYFTEGRVLPKSTDDSSSLNGPQVVVCPWASLFSLQTWDRSILKKNYQVLEF